jgi:molecular chaperone Hsp33
VDPALSAESLLWRLFHEEEETRVLPSIALRRGCRCSAEHVRQVISQFGSTDRAEMAGKDGVISVDCEFCSRQFPVRLDEFDG